ncbi:RNA-directed DNA polymerase from mobile element jockey [Eumeta japonica]|uniref:RNA-directed DNA polymerase from mobile element jockey n=1 Tax=Eumeta variegata TaxID=151549 RepID=A0A4C1ZIP8_EUMVA|nr:RNA-directed DNA polymerase from mobile element jockey [Eumeta japonica]
MQLICAGGCAIYKLQHNWDSSFAVDNQEKAECIADSIELQCSHTLPPHNSQHITLIEEEKNDKREKASRLRALSLLYSEYTNDIPRLSSDVQIALFADDTALYLRGQTERNICPHLQKAIEKLARWFQIWRIEINAEKSAAISFIYRKGRSPVVIAHGTSPLRIYNAPIPWQHTYKYLDITLDRNFYFRDHIKRIRKTAIFYQSRLKGMLGRNSKLSLRNKRTLYLMCIRTVLTYASPVFAHAVPNTLKKLQVLQNKFCRAATNAHWCVKNSVLHRDLDLPSIKKLVACKVGIRAKVLRDNDFEW